MFRYGLSMVAVLALAKAACAAPPPQTPAAEALVREGAQELVLARTAEKNKAYAQRVAHLNSAISRFQAALRLMPDDYYAYHELGFAEFMNGRLAHAVQYYSKAITLYPEAAGAYMDRGNAFYQLGQFETAGRDWQMAVRIDPSIGPNLSANLTEMKRLYQEVHPLPAA